jgi:hypothetical protein
MKYRTKVGVEFDDVKVIIEVEKESTFHNWKTLSVLLTFLITIIGVAYAQINGDTSIFDKTVDAIVKVATKPEKKDDGKKD